MAVPQPTVSIVMDGFIRVQMPASFEVQAMFDLATPEMKGNPGTIGYVGREATKASEHAIKIITDMLKRSPGLVAHDGNVGLSYAVIEGKLQYVFQLCVHTK